MFLQPIQKLWLFCHHIQDWRLFQNDRKVLPWFPELFARTVRSLVFPPPAYLLRWWGQLRRAILKLGREPPRPSEVGWARFGAPLWPHWLGLRHMPRQTRSWLHQLPVLPLR